MSNKRKEDFLAAEIEKELDEKTVSADAEVNTEDSKIKQILHSRKFAKGWLFGAVIAVFLACVVAVNIIVNVLESRYPALSVDITSTGMYQLQDYTEKLCDSLDKDVTIYLLMDEYSFKSLDNLDASDGTAYFTQANQLMKNIAAESSHIEFVYKDVAKDPSFATKYSNLNLTTIGSDTKIVVDAGDGNYTGLKMDDMFTSQVDESSGDIYITESKVEQALCTAIMSLTQKKASKVYFIASSGIAAESQSMTGSAYYSYLKEALKNNGYETGEIDLDSKSTVPADCDALVFMAPSKDISEPALEKVNKFLDSAKKKNKTFVYFPGDYTGEETPNLDAFLEEQGMIVENSWVYEESSGYLTAEYPDDNRLSTFDYDNDDFTADIESTSKVLMSDARVISFVENSNATPLLVSSDKANKLPVTAESPDDIISGDGETICGAAINKAEVADGVYKNVVVIGSYFSCSNQLINSFPQFNNEKYFINMFNVVTDNKGEVVPITTAKASDTSLGLEDASQTKFAEILFRWVLPIFVAILGIVVWRVRRKK